MDFKDLSYVIAIAKTQNITKAADMLYVTQPTLTKFLQNLEREMGQKLFKKLGNRFVLTYAGERYVAKATEILNLKKELDQEMGDIIRQNAGLLKIAFPTMRAANQQGGIITKEAPLHISNVMLVVDGQATRVGFQMDGDKKVRVAKKTGKVID